MITFCQEVESMNILWKMIGGLNMSRRSKNRFFVLAVMLLSVLGGLALYFLIGRHFLPGTEWLLCFAGYPAVFIGFFGGNMYLYSHRF